jgi:hypothetical protein
VEKSRALQPSFVQNATPVHEKCGRIGRQVGILWVHTYRTDCCRPRRRSARRSMEIALEMWNCIRYKHKKWTKRTKRHFIFIYKKILCCGLLCGTCNRALRHLLLARVQTVRVIHKGRLLFTVVHIKMANCLC